MGKLSNPGNVSRLLESHGIRLKKKWGQNFLVDENILNKIAAAADITANDTILEIGPGIGALTQKLAEAGRHVYAVEIDSRLLPVLKETLSEYTNVDVIHQDAMKTDYEAFCAQGPLKLVANLPYNVATPLFYRWLKDLRSCFYLLVCMVQKEVAHRIVANPGTKDYGTLSVICQYAAKCDIAFDVPRTVFFPRPDVSSAVVSLRPYASPQYDVGNEATFFQVVDALFAQRRKTALNTLHAAFDIPKDDLAKIGNSLDIDLTRRGETLHVSEFAKLARFIYNKVGNV